MHTLVYLSAASTMYTPEDLLQILQVSRRNNTSLGITGMLLYNEGSILQILEGEEAVIRPLFRKIQLDHRHKGVIKMLDCETSKRNFAEWSMGFHNLTDQEWADLQGRWNINDPAALTTMIESAHENVLAVIKSFAQVTRLNNHAV